MKTYNDWEIIDDYPYEKVIGFEGNYYENYYDDIPVLYTLFDNKDEIQCLVLVVKENINTNEVTVQICIYKSFLGDDEYDRRSSSQEEIL